MPRASRDTASETFAMEGFVGRYENLTGGYTVGFESYSSDSDLAEFFVAYSTTAASARTGATWSGGS